MTERLRQFVKNVTGAIESSADEVSIVPVVKSEMAKLIVDNHWLPEAFTTAPANRYSQHLLYCDPLERFCLVSFVWNPQQFTPVHDHTVWGVIGQLIGEEESISYVRSNSGKLVEAGAPETLHPGEICSVSPNSVDVHRVRNPSLVQKAISIHAYGANIGRVSRNTYDPSTGERTKFVSSYSNAVLPNIWQ